MRLLLTLADLDSGTWVSEVKRIPGQEASADRRRSSGNARPDYGKSSGARPLPSMILIYSDGHRLPC